MLSAGQLCDDGCVIKLDKDRAHVYKNNHLLFQGIRNPRDGLWDMNIPVHQLPQQLQQRMNAIIRKDATKKYLANFHYRSCFSPALSTFLTAIKKGNFITWPGLEEKLILKYLSESPATAKGHLDQERKNLQSTNSSTNFDAFPPSDIPNTKKREKHTVLLKNTAFCDPTGRYPYRSAAGNQYVFVTYDYDSNYIQASPVRTRQAKELASVWEKHHNVFLQAGAAPNHYIFDNEFSADLHKALDKYKVTYQKVQPHIHRRNAAERAIRTFKNHFLAGLASVDPKFPIEHWDHLLQQAEITVNLLRNSRINPKLSAYAIIHGNYDFNKTPLAPPGTKVAIHLKPQQRPSWGYHAEMGFYIGPALEHYRCFKCYVPTTGSVRITDTVKFFPHDEPFPQITTKDQFLQALHDILFFLKNKKQDLPFLAFGDPTKNAIETLTTLLHRNLQPQLPNPVLPKPKNTLPFTKTNVTSKRPHLIEPDIPNSPVIPQKNKCFSQQLPRVQGPIHIPPADAIAALFSSPTVQHIYNETTGARETMDTLLCGPHKAVWEQALTNEWDRLAAGKLQRVKPSNTIQFIPRSEVPPNRKVTYGNFVCEHRPLKTEKYRVRLTVGGDKLDYPDDATSPASTLIETKLLINSTISDSHKGARFLSTDLKDFFLNTPMERPEYMKVKLKYFPEAIRNAYNLDKIVSPDTHVYCKITKGMYGLKQAARIAYDLLRKRLEKHGYTPCENSINIWKHKHLPTKFCLCVDDFGVKYFSKQDANHLLQSLQKYYNITTDWTGTNFCGLTIHWNYANKYVDISMPGYVNKVLQKFSHNLPRHPQLAPHKWTESVYGKTKQTAIPLDDLPILDSKTIKYTQGVTGSLLYYARAIESPILPALNEISHRQASPTQNTVDKCKMLLDYCATHPNGKIRYKASDMILHVDTDAAYLVLPNARSRIAGYFYLANNPTVLTPSKIPLNGAIHVECRTLKHVVASAAEAETGGIFHNCQMALPIRQMLIDLGHPQPRTPIKTDNSTAYNFVNHSMRRKMSKSWDMRYNWLRDANVVKQLLKIWWEKGTQNYADYFTKHFPPKIHKMKRKQYLLSSTQSLNPTEGKGVLLLLRTYVDSFRRRGSQISS